MGTNVCLVAKNENQLIQAYDAAIAAGLNAVKIIDEHHIMPPYFDGRPILTAIGIGPARRSQIHHITKKFSVYK